MRYVNLLVRFLLELAALAGLAFAGSRAAQHSMAIMLAIAAPCCFVVLWWLFAAHEARYALPRLGKAILGVLLLEASAASLAIAGRPALASVFAVLILANAGLLYVWKQDVAKPTAHPVIG